MKLIIFLLVLIAYALNLQAEILIKAVPKDGKVEFEAIGKPSMLKIKGTGEGAEADLKINNGMLNGSIKFNLDSLKTGIEMRDKHMKEKYLMVQEDRNAILTFKDFLIPKDWSIKDPQIKEMPFSVKLHLHGLENQVNGVMSIKSNTLNSSAQFEIKLSEFKIEIPEYLGVKVADRVKINVSFEQMNLTDTKNIEKK